MGSRSRAQEATPVDQAELSDAVINGIRFGMNSIKKLTHETLPKCPTEDLRKSIAKRMEVALLKLIKAELSYTKATGIVNEVVDEMPDDVHSDATAILKTCDKISDLSMEKITRYENGLTEADLKQHHTYISLMEDIEKLLVEEEGDDEEESDDQEEEDEQEEEEEEEEEEECEAVESEEDLIPIYDPVTKTLLKDPVRNKKCGHIYGKTSITQLIKSNSKTRCPMAGCSNKEFIKVNQLVADAKLTIKIRKKQKESKSKKKK